MISIIIPVYNEEKMLKERRGYFSVISKEAELIFVDGGSSDHSVEWVSGLGHLIRSVKNRAFQMNEGAKAAKNDILLFLHVDSKIEPEAIRSMESLMRDGKYAGGCFRQVYRSGRAALPLDRLDRKYTRACY